MVTKGMWGTAVGRQVKFCPETKINVVSVIHGKCFGQKKKTALCAMTYGCCNLYQLKLEKK